MLFSRLVLQETKGVNNFILKRNHHEHVQLMTSITAMTLALPLLLNFILGLYNLF